MITTSLRLGGPLDLGRTVGPARAGRSDPRMRVRGNEMWRATRTPLGPATLRVEVAGTTAAVQAWGPGAEAAMDSAPALLGQADDASGFEPRLHPVVADLARRHTGLRLPKTGQVFDALVPAVIRQRVTGTEALASFRLLVWRLSERAPGPGYGPKLWLPPDASAVAALAGHHWPTLGLDGERAAILRRVGAVGARLDTLRSVSATHASEQLQTVPGVGVWTAAEVTLASHGDADAVSVGDFHLKNTVSYALAGEPRGTDERMLELLAPFRPHRARVIRLLETATPRAPRYGPRVSLPTHLPVEFRGRGASRGAAVRSRRW